DDAVEPTEKGKAPLLRRKGLSRPVAEGVKRCPAALEFSQNRNAMRQRTGNHLVKARAPGANQRLLVGVARDKLGFGLGEKPSSVLALIPVRGAYRCKEVLHRRLIAVEQLAVQVARVPIDEDATKIEHDHRSFGHSQITQRSIDASRQVEGGTLQERHTLLDALQGRHHRILVLDAE